MQNPDILEAQRVFEIEADSILALRERLGDGFAQAVEFLLACKGKVVLTGMGKSGLVGRKIASTMCSTGTPAVFVHPAESSHGDMGLIAPGDVVVAMSYGGDTPELSPILSYVARQGLRLIALTGNANSQLARAADVVLNVGVREEACPLGLAPTASAAATLAMGDALAMVLSKRRGFSPEQFALYHPGGSLGRRLLTRVQDVMHGGEALPLVARETPMRKVLTFMTAKEVRGVVGVIDANDKLVGVITDGDIRRHLEKSLNPLDEKASDLMSLQPKTIDAGELAEKALFLMEQFAIQTLFVVERESVNPQKPVGILHLQDLLKAKVR